MKKINLIIDDQNVETIEGKSLLEAALEAGIYVPHICSHDDLNPSGACRLCVVEVEGREGISASCMTQAETGMNVRTRTPRLKKMRRLALELMLTSHPSECTSCPKYLQCELQNMFQYLEVTDARIRKRADPTPRNTSNPLVLHDMGRCILCGRCVRACNELRGVGAITFVKKNGIAKVGVKGGTTLAEAGCKFCGACIEVCPTGSILDQEGLIKPGTSRKAALVPCRETCPAGIDIPRYIRFIREGDYPAAAAVVREKAPLPSILGHICNHLCELECRRGQINEAVSIKQLKRFAAAQDDGSWKKNLVEPAKTGKRAAVIGSGPAGLTAAYYMARLGHDVNVFEEQAHAGGMMRYGIPKYRLPWDVLDKEIGEIVEAGVDIKTGIKIASAGLLLNQGYDVVLAAPGTHQGVKLPLPGSDLEGVLINTDFLRKASQGEKVEVGDRVVVLGGGSVAFDCAGTARRLGAREVHVACLEAREDMKASAEEILEALEEGIVVHPSLSFIEIKGDNGKVAGVLCSKVCTFHFDESGRAVVECEDDSEHLLPADTVIFAVGQRPDIDADFGLPLARGNRIEASREDLSTTVTGIFAAGDAVTGTLSVIEAIAAGRKAAVSMDKYLGGTGEIDEKLAPVTEPEKWLGRDEGFAGSERRKSTCIPVDTRIAGFERVNDGFDCANAAGEAGRCLQCDLRLGIKRQKFWSEYASR